jgi:hypothetical protein
MKVDGFENIRLDEMAPNEFDFGFVGVAGIEGLPDGYYRLHYVVDVRHPEDAVVSLVDSHGRVFCYALDVMDDPHPELGARKGLAIEGGTNVAVAAHVSDRRGVTYKYLFTHTLN